MSCINSNLVPFTDTFRRCGNRVHLSNGDSFLAEGPVVDRIVHFIFSIVLIFRSIAFLIVDTILITKELGSLPIPSKKSLKEKVKAVGRSLLNVYISTPIKNVIEIVIFVFGIFFPNNARKILIELEKTGFIDLKEDINSFDYRQATT